MRRGALALGLCLVACGSPPEYAAPAAPAVTCPGPAATVVSATAVDARTVDLQIASPALGATVGVRMLLPSDFQAQPDRKWPSLWLLHGAEALAKSDVPPANYKSWSKNTDVADLTKSSEILVVMPEGGNVGWYSDWYNGGAGGPPGWETFHLCELRQILESRYRASDARAIAGLSMGGMGAMAYAARHPGMFRAAATFSGAVYTEKYYNIPELSLVVQGFDKTRLWGGGPEDVDPKPDIWKAHDPYALAGKLVGIPVFVASGNGDPGPLDAPGTKQNPIEADALDASQAFAGQLKQAGGDVTTDFYGPGTHDWPYWQRDLHEVYPTLMQAIGAK